MFKETPKTPGSWQIKDPIRGVESTFKFVINRILRTDVISTTGGEITRKSGLGPLNIYSKINGNIKNICYGDIPFPGLNNSVELISSTSVSEKVKDDPLVLYIEFNPTTSNKNVMVVYDGKGDLISISPGVFPRTKRSSSYSQLNSDERHRFISEQTITSNIYDLLEIVRTYGIKYIAKGRAGFPEVNDENPQLAFLKLINMAEINSVLEGTFVSHHQVIADLLSESYDTGTILAELERNPRTGEIFLAQTLPDGNEYFGGDLDRLKKKGWFSVKPFYISYFDGEKDFTIQLFKGNVAYDLPNGKETIAIPKKIDLNRIVELMSTQESHGWEKAFDLIKIAYSKVVRK